MSGYLYPFREIDVESEEQKRLDRFIEKTQFSDVVDLFVFDKRLRMLALDAIERIELAIQVDVAHLLGERDDQAHIKHTTFHSEFANRVQPDGRTFFTAWHEDYQKQLRRNQTSRLKSLNTEDPFLCFCIISKLLGKICPNSSWRQRFIEHLKTFPNPSNGAVKIEDFGIVDGYENWDIWKCVSLKRESRHRCISTRQCQAYCPQYRNLRDSRQ